MLKPSELKVLTKEVMGVIAIVDKYNKMQYNAKQKMNSAIEIAETEYDMTMKEIAEITRQFSLRLISIDQILGEMGDDKLLKEEGQNEI